jgi:hypothetical protein
MNITKKERRQRRAIKTRAQIRALKVARLTVHRTPRHIYAQVFDGKGERVLASRLDAAEGRRRGTQEHRQHRGRQERRPQHRRARQGRRHHARRLRPRGFSISRPRQGAGRGGARGRARVLKADHYGKNGKIAERR